MGIFRRFQRYLLRRKVRRAIVAATRAIYSEQFDMDAVSRNIADGTEPNQLRLSYIAIRTATQLSEPLSKKDVVSALEEWQSAGQDSLGVSRELASRGWQQLTERILAGKAACRKNKYSLKAIVYRMENAKRGPGTLAERAKWVRLAGQIQETERQLQMCRDEQASGTDAKAKPDCHEQTTEDQIRDEIKHLRRTQELLDDPDTICSFGQMAFDGDGVEQDYVVAANWYQIAAKQGHARAQHNLALMYEAGQGVPQDYSEAAKWYRMAAEQGNAGSQNNLGSLYENGEGLPQDCTTALEWYRRAAEGGDANGRANLQRLAERLNVNKYQAMVTAFLEIIGEHPPIIGDCTMLPYPKETMLYAFKFVESHYETERASATDPALIAHYDKMIPGLNYLFTMLADNWHRIAPEDRKAVAKLAGADSFPDWALPLKLKYINPERASKEACDAAFRLMRDQAAREKGV